MWVVCGFHVRGNIHTPSNIELVDLIPSTSCDWHFIIWNQTTSDKVNNPLVNGECQAHVGSVVADCTTESWHNWYYLSSTPLSCDTTWCTGRKRGVQFPFPRLTNWPSIWAHRYRSITSSCCNTASYTRAHARAQFLVPMDTLVRSFSQADCPLYLGNAEMSLCASSSSCQ